jgi:hypothetical protein
LRIITREARGGGEDHVLIIAHEGREVCRRAYASFGSVHGRVIVRVHNPRGRRKVAGISNRRVRGVRPRRRRATTRVRFVRRDRHAATWISAHATSMARARRGCTRAVRSETYLLFTTRPNPRAKESTTRRPCCSPAKTRNAESNLAQSVRRGLALRSRGMDVDGAGDCWNIISCLIRLPRPPNAKHLNSIKPVMPPINHRRV